MKDEELNLLLKTFDQKLNRSIEFNFKIAQETQVKKSVFALRKLRYYSIFELVVAGFVMIFLGNFIYETFGNLSLTISALILDIFAVFAISGAVRQLILISEFEVAANVTESQQILARLQTHTINYLRLAILQFPFFLAYILIGFKVFFNTTIWETGNQAWLVSNLILGVILIPVSIWVYKQIQPANLHIKWVRRLVEMMGGKEISNAMTFLNEIETFKNKK
jgi:hypothetical protein